MDNTTKLKQFSFLHANKIQDNKHKVHCIHLCCHTLSIMMIKRRPLSNMTKCMSLHDPTYNYWLIISLSQ